VHSRCSSRTAIEPNLKADAARTGRICFITNRNTTVINAASVGRKAPLYAVPPFMTEREF
jgi:hypothetical protein